MPLTELRNSLLSALHSGYSKSISITSEQKTELDKRLDAYEATKDQGKQLDEVISAIRERLLLGK